MTADAILREGRIAISRAINLKRLVGFTGSGVSDVFALPSWEKVPQAYANCVNDQIAASFEPSTSELAVAETLDIGFTKDREKKIREAAQATQAYRFRSRVLRDRLAPLVEQLNSATFGERTIQPAPNAPPVIDFSKRFDGDVLTFLSVCDQILTHLPDDEETGLSRRFLARQDFGQSLRVREAEVVRNKFCRLFRIELPKMDKKTKIPAYKDSALGDREKLGRLLGGFDFFRELLVTENWSLLKVDNEEKLPPALDEFYNLLLRTTDPSFYGGELENEAPDSPRDIIKVMMTDLGISRFATLNYDVQIERQILRDQQMVEYDEAIDFRDLCDEKKTPRPHQKRLLIESGVEKGAMSASLDQTNIAEIVNFSSYSKRFSRQVMHLHGRYDDPENIILTAEDYRRLYAERSISRDSFSNAQQALFDGNDVLFVGIGATEEDVNRPLKRFLASEQSSRHASRRAFLLFPSEACGTCFKKSQKGTTDRESYCRACLTKNEAHILDKYTQLGVHVQIYGGPKFRALRGFLEDMKTKLQKFDCDWDPKKKTLLDGKTNGCALKNQLEEFQAEEVWKHLEIVSEVESSLDGNFTLLTATEREFLEKTVASLVDEIEADQMRPEVAVVVYGILEELCSRVMSRAACAEMKAMKERSRSWWEAWNEQPFERRALYRMVSKDVSGADNYLWVRHCPDVSFQYQCKPERWVVLQKARRQAADQVARQKKRNLRIARFAVERGGGQGSFVRLMLQKSVHEFLMSDCRGPQSKYTAAFVAHLSFSMEFSSVARALTRFLSRRVAELQVAAARNPDSSVGADVKSGLSKIAQELEKVNEEDPDAQARIALNRLLKEIAPKERVSRDGEGAYKYRRAIEALEHLKEGRGPKLTPDQCQQLAEALFISRRETEPRLAEDPTCPDFSKINSDVERLHRLDVLERVLTHYANYAATTNVAPAERVLICLGGLDRLCDGDGDAHNPMHRAFFRLLTATHDHEDRDPPIDLVLLSGKRNTPICFLSEVLDPNEARDLPSHEYKKYSRHSKTEQVLRKWDRVQPFSWDERLRLMPDFCGKRGFEMFLDSEYKPAARENADRKAARTYHDWLDERDASTYSLTSDTDRAAKGLHRGLWENVGLTCMLFACWRLYCTDKRDGLEPNIQSFMKPFEGSFDRDDVNGIIGVLFKHYQRLDTESREDSKNHVLYQLILRHLALFSIPVEPWVLMGCPRVYNALLAEYDEKRAEKTKQDELNNQTTDVHDWIERVWMLNRLRSALQELHKRGLIIRILPSGLGDTEASEYEVFLHQRFSIHGRIREFIAYKMEMNIFDQGDINHHQISLYCDQPRDLPTPTPLHFEMIANVLNFQRDRSRETLGLVYRHAGGRRHGFDYVDRETAPFGRMKDRKLSDAMEAAARLFMPQDMKSVIEIANCLEIKDVQAITDLGGSLGRIHSVSQRIRGSFSLIRTAFSVGSLSRMDAPPGLSEDMPPFEQYGSWLRSIMNAAIGLRVNTRELSGVLEGTLLPKSISTPLPNYSDFDENDDEDRRNELYADLGLGMTPDIDAEALTAAAVDAQKIIDGGKKRDLDARQHTAFRRVRHPLYRDEIAWLYNERGLASLTQGRLFDALPLFRKAREVMSHKVTPASDTKAFNAVERRINLNYAIAKIERGKIRDARLILEDLKRSSVAVKFSTPSRLAPYVEGYLALCDHLGGSFETARSGYLFAIKALSDTQDLRAVAIFKRHLADLYRSIGDYERAVSEIELAVNAASKAQQRDILNLAKSSRAQILLALGRHQEARESLPEILNYAGKMGLYSHRADALLVEARIRVEVGDLGPAAHAASGAIALCTRHGLRLRKLSSLVVYGSIQNLRGLPSIGWSILENARSEAETIGYQLKAADASNLLVRQNDVTVRFGNARVGALPTLRNLT